MKIGILSMHKVKNHGSFLQAYALMSVVKSISDADVEFVDFDSRDGIKDPCKETYLRMTKSRFKFFIISCGAALTQIPLIGRLFAKNRRLRTWRNMISFFKLYSVRYEREFWKLLPFSNRTLSETDADLVIIGSDEVFNYKINSSVGYSDQLFGAGGRAERMISFSACFGNTSVADISEETVRARLAGYLSCFDGISVRDKNSIENVRFLLGDDVVPEYHLDPVLHYSFERELPKIRRRRPYVAVYSYDGLEIDAVESIEKYAKDRRLDVICLHGYQSGFGEYIGASPFEVLAYIKNAECVFTNTFHGMVFSVKYNKRFCVRLTDSRQYSNTGKLGDLIERLNLGDRIAERAEDISGILDKEVDFTYANNYVLNVTENGTEYLKKHLAER